MVVTLPSPRVLGLPSPHPTFRNNSNMDGRKQRSLSNIENESIDELEEGEDPVQGQKTHLLVGRSGGLGANLGDDSLTSSLGSSSQSSHHADDLVFLSDSTTARKGGGESMSTCISSQTKALSKKSSLRQRNTSVRDHPTETLESLFQTTEATATAECTTTTTPLPVKSVGWGSIQWNSHLICLGDNPSCSCGPPLTMAWRPMEQILIPVDDYEASLVRHRTKKELLLPKYIREDWLRTLGYSRQELNEAEGQVLCVQKQREQSRLAYEWRRTFCFWRRWSRTTTGNSSNNNSHAIDPTKVRDSLTLARKGLGSSPTKGAMDPSMSSSSSTKQPHARAKESGLLDASKVHDSTELCRSDDIDLFKETSRKASSPHDCSTKEPPVVIASITTGALNVTPTAGVDDRQEGLFFI